MVDMAYRHPGVRPPVEAVKEEPKTEETTEQQENTDDVSDSE